MIHSGKEISIALASHWDEVLHYADSLPDDQFEKAPKGKWTAGQHLEHLLRSAAAVSKGLAYPKFVIRLITGKPNRPSRDYEATLARYHERIEQGGRASGKFVPPPVPLSRKAELVNAYTKEKNRMLGQLGKWSEKNLDNYLFPHPLLGKVTVREMMFFTTFHTRIHLDIMKRDFGHD